jgi:hypothetical protein
MSTDFTTSAHNSHPNPFAARLLLAHELAERWQDATLEERLDMILTHCQGADEWCHPAVLDTLAAYVMKPDVWLRIVTAAKHQGITPNHLKVAVDQLRHARAREAREALLKRIN